LLLEFLDRVPERDPRHRYAMALVAEMDAIAGELEAAERWAAAALELTIRIGQQEHPPTNQVHIALGVVPFERGDLDAAEEQFERAATLVHRGRDQVETAHVLLWLAAVHARQDDADAGQEALAAARALVSDLGHPTMRWLIDALELGRARPHTSAAIARPGDPLSDAELRILRMLPGDLSYREIAHELSVSLNTVRTHASRLRRKLGVSTRSGAVAVARERALL